MKQELIGSITIKFVRLKLVPDKKRHSQEIKKTILFFDPWTRTDIASSQTLFDLV